MRYTVHTQRTFHHRITKYLGVLVGAALIATLGLPSAVQAQTPAPPTVAGSSGADAAITAMWGQPLGSDSGQDQWLVEYTEPGVAWDDATEMVIDSLTTRMHSSDANDPRIHHGVWRFRVSYYDADLDPDNDIDDVTPAVIGSPSALTDYHHGPPTAAPTGLTAHDAGPGARRLVWDDMDALTYELRSTADATDDDAWTDWEMAMSGDVVDDLEMGTEYTFEVRGLGMSRAGVGDLHGPSASTAEMMPVPTPTLPEIAALFLAMLLLGSGAYLLRRRQSGGLTPA